MTKLEELRAALLLSADAPWMRKVHTASERYSVWAACGTDREHQIAGDMNEHNAVFIQRAHNLMPALLEAVELLPALIDYAESATLEGDEMPDFVNEAIALLEKLK